MPVGLNEFVEKLSQSGVMSGPEIQAYLGSLPPTQRPQDGDTLATRLVQAGKLTQYQAAAVSQGKGKNLVFDEYVILDKLGQGGMGVVLKARHRRMHRLVAVKILPAATMKSSDAVQRFYREVQAAARLSHPNIVAAYDAREYHGSHSLVMEYVEGKDLAVIVKEHGPLPVRQAVECIVQAARGLQYAHEQGIIHRDIKPANLLLDTKGTVKILDMGLARIEQAAAEEAGGDRLTQSGQVMGTGDYMAPEQALNTHEADARSDIYSLGCTLYRLLTGKTPYKGETFTQLFLAHREAPIPSLCDARPDVPAELDAIFQKMVAKYAHERQQSMTEVIADLEGCLGMRRGGTDDGDSLSNGALSFLREMTAGGAATRHVAGVKVRQTFDHNGHPETGTNIGRRLLRAVRRQKPLGIALAAVAALVLFGIIITIRGRKDGQVDITPPAPGSAGGKVDEDWQRSEKRWGIKRSDLPSASSPLSPGGRGVGGEGAPSPFIGPDGNWKLPPGTPPPAVAPFDAKKASEHRENWSKHLGMPVEQTNSIGMKLILIPPGEFDMGSTPEEIASALEEGKKNKESQVYLDQVPSEGPRHRVKIGKPFYLAMQSVTQAEYEKVMGVNPSAFAAKQMEASAFNPSLSEGEVKARPGDAKKVAGQDTSRHPVETVSWDDSEEFCRRVSAMPEERKARRVYRLPTEAEWEYACRAGTTTRWWCGADEAGLMECAWYTKNAGGMTHPVGEKKPNAWGLYDMHGNVWQWCADWYDGKYYGQSPGIDPTGPSGGSHRVFRGGGWGNAPYARSAFRNYNGPGYRSRYLGLRACVVPAE